jgi:hypothetical protein
MPRPRPVNTAQAAELAGMDQATFRKAMMRERQRGRDYRLPEAQWVDKRTPLYDGTAVESWAKGRKS